MIVPAAWMRPFIRRLAQRWNTPALARGLTVTWNPRLRRSLGRASLATRSIRLHPSLHDAPRVVVREILAHELAHLVVAIRSRRHARPHGDEWKVLMSRAGYEPRRRVPFALPDNAPKSRRIYLHTCPVCHATRRGKRPVPAWRCTQCVANGLDGRLVIEVTR